MLAVDFNEEYFRVGQETTDNQCQVFVDTNGRIVFTTDVFQENRIKLSDDIFAGQTGRPRNATFLLDNLTIFSTNGDIVSRMPLKVTVNQKPSFVLGAPDIEVLDRYDVLNDNDYLVTYPRIGSADYLDRTNYVSTRAGTARIDASAILGSHIYYGIYNETGYLDYNITTGQTTAQDVVGQQLRAIRTSETDQVGVAFFQNAGGWVFRDLVDNTIITAYPNTDRIVTFRCVENVLIVLLNEIATGEGTIDFYQKERDGSWLRLHSFVENNTNTQNIIDAELNLFDRPTFYVGEVGGNRYVGLITYDSAAAFFDTTLFGTETIIVPSKPISIWLGGENKDSPVVNILGDGYWYGYSSKITVGDGGVGTLDLLNSWKQEIFTPETNQYDVKRFYNQAYYWNYLTEESAMILNLSNGKFVEWDVQDFRIDTASRYTTLYQWGTLHFSQNGLVVIGRPFDLAERVLIKYYQNSHPFNQVTKLAYNYDGLEYPFTIPSNELTVEITQNQLSTRREQVTTKELEIFKIVLDFRIRYSLEPIKLNEATPSTVGAKRCVIDSKGKRRCFIKTNRKVGDVEDVLGYVDDDFTVNDFLQIYTT